VSYKLDRDFDIISTNNRLSNRFRKSALVSIDSKKKTATFGLWSTSAMETDNNRRIAAGYGMDGYVSIPGEGKRLFSVQLRPGRFWGPPSLLSNGYRWLFPRI
jgi:hypothetical protein